jgi:F0F1-type ATP synthase delta subunit
MRIRRTYQQQARRLWHLCQHAGRPNDDLLHAAIEHLVTRQPRGFLPVLHCLRHRMDLMQRLATAHIFTADPLADAPRQDMERAVRRRFPAVTRMIHETDPGLLAGVRVQAGYDVIDDSLLGKLNRLHQKLQT